MESYSFPQQTSIHGVKWVFVGKKVSRLLWLSITGLILWFAIRQVNQTVTSYLSFASKTAQQHVELNYDTVPFPAVTFCPNQVYLRHIVGRSLPLVGGVYQTITGDLEPSVSQQLCSDPTSERVYDIKENKYGDVDFMKLSQVDSYKAVKECRLNGKRFNCSLHFLNKATELGWCFTFNTGPQILKSYKLAGDSTLLNNVTPNAYGTYANFTSNINLSGGGRRNSISLMLLSNSSEYCLPLAIQGSSAGYATIIHDPDVEPLLSSKPNLIVNPGFATNINIQIRKSVRTTEHLGYCHSQLPLKYFPNVQSYTNRDNYIINCLSAEVVAKCNCSAYFAPPTLREMNRFSEFVCGLQSFETLYCYLGVFRAAFHTSRECFKNVPIPCEETALIYHQTASKFASPNMVSHYMRQLNFSDKTTLEDFRDNFALVNFYVASKQFELYTEDQKMTWIDLMNQLGGTAGMCLGTSILSVVELVSWVVYTVASAFIRLPVKTNVTKPRKTVYLP